MDSGTAKVLFKEGAFLVFLDMPEGSEFGIDYNSWTTGPKFRGVKMIPPGLHFVYYSAKPSQDRSNNCGIRTGFFKVFKQREVVVKKWDKADEDLKPDQISSEEQTKIEQNLKELDQYLGPYPYENYKKWISLTGHMSEDLVLSWQPECGFITSVTQFLSPCSNSESRKQDIQDQKSTVNKDGLPNLTTVPGTEIRFTKIPKQRYPDGANPQEVTKHSMDSTFILETLLKTQYRSNKNGILGEIQFAFICFLIAQVYEAFDQWKKLVHIMCSSESALNTHTDLFMNFVAMLHYQVHEIPEDFFVDIVSSNNFLTSTLQEFFSNIDAGNGEEKLRTRGRKFREHLTRKFQWDFSAEPDEYAPVVVDSDVIDT